MKYLFLIVLLVALRSSAQELVVRPVFCFPLVDNIAKIQNELGEKQQFSYHNELSNNRILLYENNITGTWSLFENDNGKMCWIGAGKNQPA